MTAILMTKALFSKDCCALPPLHTRSVYGSGAFSLVTFFGQAKKVTNTRVP
jgi:hypothetical protein